MLNFVVVTAMVSQLQSSKRKVNKDFYGRHAAFLHCTEFPPPPTSKR